MKPVRFNPKAQRLIIEFSSSGRVETRKGRIFTILMLVFSVFLFTSPTRLLGPTRGLAQGSRAEVVVVGSAGVIDESDLAEYEVRNQFATIKDSLETATVTYRYNLPAVENFDDGTAGVYSYTVRVRYRDTGENQQVIVRLRAAGLGADGVTTIYTFSSDSGGSGGGIAGIGSDNPNGNANQTFDECDVTLPEDHLNHGKYGYFLEVEIRKLANDGTPSPGFIGFVMSDSGIDDSACDSPS